MTNEYIHEKIENHDKRLNSLEQDGREYKIQIVNLCDQVRDLITTMKWFMGLFGTSLLTSLLGFFFYAIQQNLFR